MIQHKHASFGQQEGNKYRQKVDSTWRAVQVGCSEALRKPRFSACDSRRRRSESFAVFTFLPKALSVVAPYFTGLPLCYISERLRWCG